MGVSYTCAAKELKNVKQSWQSNGNDAKHNQKVNKNNIRERISVSVYLTVQRNGKNVNCNSFYDKKFNVSDKLLKTLVII
jgi:23S rRNA pseudoU1915 N3-methylase RlmH